MRPKSPLCLYTASVKSCQVGRWSKTLNTYLPFKASARRDECSCTEGRPSSGPYAGGIARPLSTAAMRAIKQPRKQVVTAALGHSQTQRSRQCVTGLLGINRISDGTGNGLMEGKGVMEDFKKRLLREKMERLVFVLLENRRAASGPRRALVAGGGFLDALVPAGLIYATSACHSASDIHQTGRKANAFPRNLVVLRFITEVRHGGPH
ncbi:hypothetical protein EVAR_70249_1 [Eumeta japonica]|uniref:Uncharacterized protein n=1 Tax=Eumeta variegata TaxID=151549 RepID=A0A4C2A8B6_EUMVA|nr:hypothetical protein EVAR_70249_1 [Eumeta japonica]